MRDPLERPVRDQGCFDHNALVVHTARPAGHERNLCVVRTGQFQVVRVYLAGAGHTVNKLYFGGHNVNVDRVLLYQFGNFGQAAEDAAFAGDEALKVGEEPAAALLTRGGRAGDMADRIVWCLVLALSGSSSRAISCSFKGFPPRRGAVPES